MFVVVFFDGRLERGEPLLDSTTAVIDDAAEVVDHPGQTVSDLGNGQLGWILHMLHQLVQVVVQGHDVLEHLVAGWPNQRVLEVRKPPNGGIDDADLFLVGLVDHVRTAGSWFLDCRRRNFVHCRRTRHESFLTRQNPADGLAVAELKPGTPGNTLEFIHSFKMFTELFSIDKSM